MALLSPAKCVGTCADYCVPMIACGGEFESNDDFGCQESHPFEGWVGLGNEDKRGGGGVDKEFHVTRREVWAR